MGSIFEATSGEVDAAAKAAPPVTLSAPVAVVKFSVEYDKPIALANSVARGSPADTAGMKAGDVILAFGTATSFNGSDAATISDVVRRNVGNSVPVIVRREGEGLLELVVSPGPWEGRGLLGYVPTVDSRVILPWPTPCCTDCVIAAERGVLSVALEHTLPTKSCFRSIAAVVVAVVFADAVVDAVVVVVVVAAVVLLLSFVTVWF